MDQEEVAFLFRQYGLVSAPVVDQRGRLIGVVDAHENRQSTSFDSHGNPVLVTERDGREGRFDRNGNWVAGEVFRADPELCRWIVSGGKQPGGAGSRSRRFETEETFS